MSVRVLLRRIGLPILGITFLVVAGLLFRLHDLQTPLADWHSWRQADTVSVTREYVKHNYPLLLPHYQDLSDIPNGLNNVAGYRMVEFPIVNYAIAQVMKVLPAANIVVVSRLFSIMFSLVTIVSLYVLVWLLSRKWVLAWWVAAFFAFTPYTVYYSRTALPEPVLVMSLVLSVTFFSAWVQAIKRARQTRHPGLDPGSMLGNFLARFILGLLATASFAAALLFKPMAGFFLPVFAIIALYELGWRAMLKLELYLFGLAALPLVWWRHWIAQYPSGIPASDWLFNGNGIRLRPAWWRWLFADRFGRLISGYWGVVFLFMGAVWRMGKTKLDLLDWVTLSWLGCGLLYLVVIATGNVQHDYYQYLLTPLFALLMGRGVMAIWHLAPDFAHPLAVACGLALTLALFGMFSWYEVSGYYNINNPAIVAAGQAVDKLTPADAKVIAPYNGDTAFLFQTNRTGWPIGGRVGEKIQQGATYYVTTTNDDEEKQLAKQYPVVMQTSDFTIIHLVPLTVPTSTPSARVAHTL